MPNSGSGHEKRRNPVRLVRALSRRPYSRPLEGEDLKWLWAAYRKGSFPEIAEGLDSDGFTEKALDVLARSHAQFLLWSRRESGDRPVGLVLCHRKNHVLEPHVFWFAWATRREKIETALSFLNEQRRSWLIMISARERDRGFFAHLCRYGFIRPVGTVFGGYGKGQPAHLFQTREP